MADTPSIRIVKSSPYKGGTKLWGNRHHFNGGTPADLTHWTTLANAIATAEKAAAGGTTSFVEAICYGAGSDVPLHTITLSGTGSVSATGATVHCPLEVSALIRWSTDQRTSKNHPIYLFAYMRDTMVDTSVGFEALSSLLKTPLTTYMNDWVSGFSDGTLTLTRAGPRGASALGGLVETYVTHRDFAR